jgi:FkbM family methyltransferase
VRRRLPTRLGGGPIWLSPESALRYWTWSLDHPRHSKTLVDVAVRFTRPGTVVWDIGANCGVFAVACSGLAGPSGFALAVEPDTTTSECLHRNAALAPSANRSPLAILECAVSDHVGTSILNIANRGRATNFLGIAGGRSDTGGVRSSRRVITVTLDWLMAEFPLPNIMKIDVEGAELLALHGGKAMLWRARPVVLVEVAEHTRQPVVDILEPMGYRFLDADRLSEGGGYGQAANLLAVPIAQTD